MFRNELPAMPVPFPSSNQLSTGNPAGLRNQGGDIMCHVIGHGGR
jgi:hypothetical protein